MTDNRKLIEDRIKKIQRQHNLQADMTGNENEGYSVQFESLPKSLEEAKRIRDFWSNYLERENVKNLQSISFVNAYEEELPLTGMDKILNFFGYDVKNETEQNVSYHSIDSLSGVRVNPDKGLATILTSDKEKWRQLNEIDKNKKSFGSSYTLMPEPLGHQIYVPLETIYKVETQNKPLEGGNE